MATFTANLTYTCTIEIEVPDSKVKSYLENELAVISDHIELKFDGMPPTVSCEIDGVDIVLDDYSYITKDNGNDYEWDGEKLIKL
jgi:hypothetical protein